MDCNGSCREFCLWLKELPHYRRCIIPKERLPSLPECFSRTILGEMPPGAVRQYRGPHASHVHEYPDRWVIHRDRVNADEDPIGHLLNDAPEYLVTILAMLLTGMGARRAAGGRRGTTLLVGGLAGAFALLTGKMLKVVEEEPGEEIYSGGPR
ncbi:MAG: hypothetical protein JW986_03245 [Methanotrichaceae archaeon]|nr:hypothetical protein [Methanotrichaceae archaeon]